jgi:serine/threonine protein kinase
MALSAGTRLGPYEILALVGAGGMGEVYRAKDTRLDRIVAIKVLPAGLSSAPESLERFKREARAVSALNHPNICSLYDIGEDAGRPFLVLEFLEGRNMRDRLLSFGVITVCRTWEELEDRYPWRSGSKRRSRSATPSKWRIGIVLSTAT